MSQLTVGSLFSGIGGIDLGLERAGMRTRWFSEVDPYASRVLAKHWPDVPNHGDITQIDFRAVEPVDVLAGGFPCQDISVAGAQAGIMEGTRSGLWFEYARAIRDLRPRYVLVENVANLLANGMGIVLGELSALGYDAFWRVFSAGELGAPHLRDRVFIVAYPHSERLQGGFGEWARQRVETLSAAALRLALPASSDAGVDDGIPQRVDGGVSDEGEEGRSGAPLRTVWEDAVAEAVLNGAFGGPGTLPPSAVLRHGVPAPRADQPGGHARSDVEIAGAKASEARLRELWGQGATTRPPQGQGHSEQRSEQLADTLRALSQPSARRTAGASRGLGNAVVPQIPELVGGWIVEHARAVEQERAA